VIGRLRFLIIACACLAPSIGTNGVATAADNAVVFMYHHVDDATPASTSISPADFRAQIEYLEREGYAVLPLLELLDALANGRPVPDKSVAITFDDGYRSVLTAALPLLRARQWPFTVFVNTEAVDSGFGIYLSWDDLRALGAQGAAIGNHSVSHTHLVRQLQGESETEWRQRVRREIADATVRLESEVGEFAVPVFAYPYGEYTREIKSIVMDLGLYGMGQQSGAIGPSSDFLALPRYPIATGIELAADFAVRARSRALPVHVVGDERHVTGISEARPVLRLALDDVNDVRSDALACYATGQGRMLVEWSPRAAGEFTVQPKQDLGSGRSKYNCTAPSRSRPGVYYWFGYLWMRRFANGGWYDE